MQRSETVELFLHASAENFVAQWIDQGGGVMLAGSQMGCGLNVMSCLKFIDRSDLTELITRLNRGFPSGLMISDMIDRITDHFRSEFTRTNIRLFRNYSSFEGNRQNNIRTTLDHIKSSIINSTGGLNDRYVAAIVKLIINPDSGLGHTILIVYDRSTSTMITFDPQLCKPPAKNGIRSFDDFYGYLLTTNNYKGLSYINSSMTTGGKRKTRKNNKRGKTKRKNKRSKTKRNNKRGGKAEELSTDVEKNFKFILDFVNEGDNVNNKNKEMLEETIKSLNEWYDSGKQIKF